MILTVSPAVRDNSSDSQAAKSNAAVAVIVICVLVEEEGWGPVSGWFTDCPLYDHVSSV